jgi:archaetidylinositol phosphate synthase
MSEGFSGCRPAGSGGDTQRMTSSADATTEFGGASKVGQSILGPAERRFIDRYVPLIPARIRSWQLTMLTIVWSGANIGFALLARHHHAWLFAMSAMVVAQWFTDSFDGTLGKNRGEGLVKWGFVMDHFLDTIFAGSVVIGYSLIAPPSMSLLFQILLLVTLATMALSFLSFGATNEFQIAHFGLGPTEVRIGYVALNTIIYFAGVGVFTLGAPLMLIANVGVLIILAYRLQLRLWKLDKAALISS